MQATTRWLATLARFSGVPFLIREVLCRHRCGILLYHDPDPELFERHLAYLSRNYSLIPFATLVDAIAEGDWSRIPPKSLVIHLDDGYASNYRLAGTLRRFGVRPTLYACSHVVGSRRQFWSRLAGGRAKALRLADHAALLEKLEREADFRPEREASHREALSREELREMAEGFDIQSHGRYHFSLLTLSDDEVLADLRESRTRIEALTGRSVEHFSFPYGDYGSRELEMVRRCGYQTARTTEPGWNGPRSDLHRLRILADVPADASLDALFLHLTGVPRYLKRLAYRLVTRRLHARRQRRLMRRRFF